MKRNKAPAFQFYPADFLSDKNVMLMNEKQIGIYIKLICFCWMNGSIPSDLDVLARLATKDPETFLEDWKWIEPCFEKSKKNIAELIHPRLEKERAKQKEYNKTKSEAGAKGAKKRWGQLSSGDSTCHSSAIAKNSTAIDLPMAKNNSSSSSSSSSSRNSNELLEDIYCPTSAKSDAKPTPKAKFKFEPEHMAFADEMREYIVEKYPYYEKKINIEQWADTIRKLNKVDGYTIEQIEDVFVWAAKDKFWSQQIRSPDGLRSHWQKLLDQSGMYGIWEARNGA